MHGLWISHIGFSGFKTKYGAIAQLGERHTGSVEVSGSIPLSSTNISRYFGHSLMSLE
jgi:hypothetical protein